MIRRRLHRHYLRGLTEGEALWRVVRRNNPDSWHARYHHWFCERYGGEAGPGLLGFWRGNRSPLLLVPVSMLAGWAADWACTWSLRP